MANKGDVREIVSDPGSQLKGAARELSDWRKNWDPGGTLPYKYQTPYTLNRHVSKLIVLVAVDEQVDEEVGHDVIEGGAQPKLKNYGFLLCSSRILITTFNLSVGSKQPQR